MASLCLNMIVRNESARILRCLESVRPVIDSYAILDTGSTDGTPEILRRFMAEAHIPGVLDKGEFRHFSQARNQALDLAEEVDGWTHLLLCDADMELRDESRHLVAFEGAVGFVNQFSGGTVCPNIRVVRRDVNARYVGVTHEYLDHGRHDAETLPASCHFVDHADGANSEGRFARDVHLLTQELVLETDPDLRRRYTFFLGITFRAAGLWSRARACFLDRSLMGGWDQEVFCALLYAARIRRDHIDGIGAVNEYREAARVGFAANRIEADIDLIRLYREHGHLQLASDRASTAVIRSSSRPLRPLFLEHYAYDVGALDEFATCAWELGDIGGARMAWGALINRRPLNAYDRIRIENNLTLSSFSEGQA